MPKKRCKSILMQELYVDARFKDYSKNKEGKFLTYKLCLATKMLR